MPFKSIPEQNFVNRDAELSYLKRLIDVKDSAIVNNVLLEGTRGIGKTELLKQLYRSLFWQGKNVIPFYYSFQRATLKVAYFAKDYFTRFVRQYLAFLKKDPSIIDNMSIPLTKLIPLFSTLKLTWMIELIEDFQEHIKDGDLHEQLLGAISIPAAVAGKSGNPVLVMLDDFHLATQLYETHPGDVPGLISLFERSMTSTTSPHILTGSPEGALEMIFTDDSFRGKAERMILRAMPEDAAFSMFRSLCAAFGITVRDECREFMKFLGGNPLYIKNMAKALWKMQRKEASLKDLWECYSYEVSDGETAFYWSSIFRGFLTDLQQRRIAIELLMHSIESHCEVRNLEILSKALGIPVPSLKSVLDALQISGIIQTTGSIRPVRDNILQDFIRNLYLREVEERDPEKIRKLIESRYQLQNNATSCFEMTIPMTADAELVAAKAIEQIGKNISLKPLVITQLQLAIIEACINAMEHSGSYDKKVLLKFTVNPERIEIAIETPGKRFDPDTVKEPTIEEKLHSEHKRGWGLKLMREVMDDVKVETIGDRTRVVLIKNIKSEVIN
jgi:serine/threonine-protein kinase RsbW